MTVRVLSIAGTDPTGGAGVQADLKSIAALGGYGMAVVTCLVAQNTHGVRSVHTPPVAFLREQLDAVSDDVTIDAVKIGMLGTADVAATVHAWLSDQRAAGHRFPVVLDPVMVASSGDRLLDPTAEDAVRALACAHADLLTPNLAELAVLDGAADGLGEQASELSGSRPSGDPGRGGSESGEQQPTWDAALAAGRRVASATDSIVLVKGGHLPGERAPDALVGPDGDVLAEVAEPRVPTRNTHGTGCSLSSAMATLYARTGAWPASLAAAKRWLTGALAAADGLDVGSGTGPVHHGHHLDAAVDAYLAEPVPFTDELWARSAAVRQEIDELEFITKLADGSLPPERFRAYLAQDAQYLQAYSRALSALAASSAPAEVRAFFARGAVTAATEETILHRQWLHHDAAFSRPAATTSYRSTAGSVGPTHGSDETPAVSARPTSSRRSEIGRVTAQYTDFLLAATAREPWQIGAAAVLPCYWLYAEIAATLSRGLEAHRSKDAQDHPYATWLAAYDDPGFQEAAAACRVIVDDAAATADEATRHAMTAAFLRACELERDFFAAEPSLMAGG